MKTQDSVLVRPIRIIYYKFITIPAFVLDLLNRICFILFFSRIKYLFQSDFFLFKLMIKNQYFDGLSTMLFSRILNKSFGDIPQSIFKLTSAIRYSSKNSWKSPLFTILSSKGDCKSTSLLIGYYLAWLRIPFDIYTVFNSPKTRNGHAIILFRFKKMYYVADNTDEPESLTLDEFKMEYPHSLRAYSYVP